MHQFDQFAGCEARAQFGNARVEIGLARHQSFDRGEAFLCRKGFVAHQRDNLGEMIEPVRHDADMPVPGREGLAMRIDLSSVAGIADRRVECVAAQMFLEHEAAERLEHGNFDMLSGARAQAMDDRTHHGIGGVQPGYLVRDQRRQVAWASIAIGARKQCCRPARGLDDIVIGLQPGIGPTRSEAYAMRVDDVGGQFTDGVVVEAQPCDRFGANVVDEDVGVAQQVAQYASVGILLEIEQERLLAAVERDITRCHPRRACGTRRVAKDIPAGCLHLDDLGAEIGEDLGAIGPENDRGHVDHAQPFEHRAIVARFDHSISFSGMETSASVSGATSACATTSLRPCA